MRKIAFVLAAVGALMLASAPTMEANASAMKLWEGWVKDMKQVRADVRAKWQARLQR